VQEKRKKLSKILFAQEKKKEKKKEERKEKV
jgi:hypothetical protein